MTYDEDNEDTGVLKKIMGYQVGNMVSVAPGPLTAVGVAVDYLMDEEEDDFDRGTRIEVSEESRDQKDDISSKPENTIQIQGGENNMTDYEDPAELVAAAEEGDLSFEQYQAEVDAFDDVSDEEAAYLGMTGAQLYLRDEVENLEANTEALLETKYDTDELIDETIDEMEGWREVYVDHMNEAIVSMVNSRDYAERANENVEEAHENLEGKNEEMEEALEESPLDSLRSLEADVNAALTSDETTEE